MAAEGPIDEMGGMIGETGAGVERVDDGGHLFGMGTDRQSTFTLLRLRVFIIGLFPAE